MRLLIEDGVSDSYGLSVDDMLASRVGAGLSKPTLRLYTYKSYAALCGRFQNIENEIDLSFCAANGIRVNRRPTGGGAIIMGEDQLGMALVIPGSAGDNYSRARELMSNFSGGITDALMSLGVHARFRGKNDIEVNARKIVGLGIYRSPGGGLLFHASLLLDIDVAFMMKVLKTSFAKISDKEIAVVGNRITSIVAEAKTRITMEELRTIIARSYSNIFDEGFVEEELTDDEKSAVAQLEESKYMSGAWKFQFIDQQESSGSSRLKTPAGLIDINLRVKGNTITSIFIHGDFFTSEKALAELEANLKWHSTDPRLLKSTITAFHESRFEELSSLPLEGILSSINQAVGRAKLFASGESAGTYGCFVNPNHENARIESR